jgi:arylsulfatase A-like enzyme
LIGILLGELERQGLRQRTLIVLVSDHGEAFYEHGYEGHARDLYGETVRTPFVIGLPFRLEEGLVVDTGSQNVDVWPTLFDLIGIPRSTVTDGRSRLSELLGIAREEDDADVGVAHLDRTWGRRDVEPRSIIAITQHPYRLIVPDEENELDEIELYNVESDPTEQKDLAQLDLDTVEELSRYAQDYFEDQIAPWGDEERVELDEMHLRQLRALGYEIE